MTEERLKAIEDLKLDQVSGVLMNKLEVLKNQALAIVRATSPYRTGNLSRSFKIRVTDDGFEIYTDVDYMVYTEEKWMHPRWRGRKNPNEAWLKETTEFIAQYIAQQLGGMYVSNG